MKLYVYDHCPFSMRPRLIAGINTLPVEICVLRISDDTTAHSLVGKKVVPILEKDDGSCMTESLNIALYLDALGSHKLSDTSINSDFETLRDDFLKDYVALTSPCFIHSCREFQSDSDISRYQQREEAFLEESFDDLKKHVEARKSHIENCICSFIPFITSSDPSDSLTATELVLFPYLHHLKTQVNVTLAQPLLKFWQNLSPNIPV